MQIAPPPALPEVPRGVEPRRTPAWSPWMGLGSLLTVVVAAGVLGAIVYAVSGDPQDPPTAARIVAIFLGSLAMIGTAVGFAALTARPRPWQFGLQGTRFWPAVGWTALTFVVFAILSQIFLQAVGADTTDDIPDELGIDDGLAAAIAISFAVTVMAPLGEELFFRGYLYGSFRRWGVAPAALMVGVLFGALHFGGSDALYLAPLALFGVLLCLLREKTGSLYPTIGLHWLNNCMALSVSQSWDWQVPVVFAGSGTTILLVLLAVRRVP